MLTAYDSTEPGACPRELRFHCALANTQNMGGFLRR
jgi:hypothetical protein